MQGQEYLTQIIFFLAAAVVFVPVFKKLKLSSVLGYLTAGFVVGPSVLGLIKMGDHLHTVAEFGIVFLLFLIGMELSLERLKLMRTYIFGLGGLQVTLTALAIFAVCTHLNLPPNTAVTIALALSLSSTAFVMQLLSERDEQLTQHGRISFSVLLMQDLAVVPILALLPFLSLQQTDQEIGSAIGSAMLIALAAIVAIILVGKVILKPLYRVVAMAKAPELFPAVTLLILFGTGAILLELGISMTLSAFLCGILIAETEYRHQVEADIAPFKGMLLGLFFMTVGIGINLNFILENLGLISLIVVSLLFFKATITALICFAFGIRWSVCGRIGMLLAQGGEFAFVILGAATLLNIVTDEIAQLLIAVVALSMVATPFMDWLGQAWNTFFHPVGKEDLTDIREGVKHIENHVIIGGFGRVGQTAARILSSLSIPYIALDLDEENVRRCRNKGIAVYYGDVTSLAVIKDTDIHNARAVLLTLDNQNKANKAVDMLKKNFPDMPVISRSHDEDHAAVLTELGAFHTVPDLTESSLQLTTGLLRTIGVNEDIITDTLQKQPVKNKALS